MRSITGAWWLLLLPLLVYCGSPCLAADGDRAIAELARSAGQRDPQMRIGLEPAHAVELSSDRSFRLVDPKTGQAVWKPRFEETVREFFETVERLGKDHQSP